MVSKVLFWTGFGLAVRFWQLGIQMRPFFAQRDIWMYPIFGGTGALVGYWLQGTQDRKLRYLEGVKQELLERRQRRMEREELNAGTIEQKTEHGMVPSPHH